MVKGDHGVTIQNGPLATSPVGVVLEEDLELTLAVSHTKFLFVTLNISRKKVNNRCLVQCKSKYN